jgi:hydrogenase maturation protease
MSLPKNYTQNLKQIDVDLSKLLQDKPRLVILGIGENRMGDDGAGQYISFHLDDLLKLTAVKIINGGISPDHRLEDIAHHNPEILLVIDAIKMEMPPGNLALLEETMMRNYLPISTHTLPLPVFLDRVKTAVPKIRIYLVGISPYSLAFSEKYELFQEDKYSMDDYETNLNLPFYAFHFSVEMVQICNDLVKILNKRIRLTYSLDN